MKLYLRKEPTIDTVWLTYGDKGKRYDVCAYLRKHDLKPLARWSWEHQPKKNCKSVMLNCYRWPVVWLPDLKYTDT
jgi:hypothetical protein